MTCHTASGGRSVLSLRTIVCVRGKKQPNSVKTSSTATTTPATTSSTRTTGSIGDSSKTARRRRPSQFLDEHLRTSAAAFPALAPRRRQVVGRAQVEPALLHKVVDGLSR